MIGDNSSKNLYKQLSNIVVYFIIVLCYASTALIALDQIITKNYYLLVASAVLIIILSIFTSMWFSHKIEDVKIARIFYYLSFFYIASRRIAFILINNNPMMISNILNDCIYIIVFVVVLGLILDSKQLFIAVIVPFVYHLFLLLFLPKTFSVTQTLIETILMLLALGAFISYWKKTLDKYINQYTKTVNDLKNEIDIIKKIESQTGLLNKKASIEIATLLQQKGIPFSCIFLDIDNFKDINDKNGHIIGDIYISKMVEMINTFCDEKTHFGRYGGDEFIIIKESDNKDIEEFLKNILDSLNNHEEYNISISIGESKCKNKNITIDEVFHNADQAMYFTKATGKNNYTLYEDIERNKILIKEIFEMNN